MSLKQHDNCTHYQYHGSQPVQVSNDEPYYDYCTADDDTEYPEDFPDE